MPSLPATKAARDKITAIDGKQTDYNDVDQNSVPGLILRVTAKGQRTWALRAKRPGHPNKSRFNLGDYREMTITEARQAALAFKAKLREGIDPLAQRQEKIAAAKAAQLDIIDDLILAFNTHCEATNKTGKEQSDLMNKDVLPYWKGRNIKSITRRDVRAIVEQKKQQAPVRANRLLTLIKRFFSWAIEQDAIDNNPARDMKPVTQETSRDRVLSDTELQAVWDAANDVGAPFGAITQLLMLTAQRLSEVAGMSWDEVDFEKAEWAIPASRSKNGVENRVPLSDAAAAIIKEQPRVAGSDFVFPSGRNPKTRHVSGYSKAKKRIDRLSGVSEWRYHDLRRTAASGMARLGIAPHVVEKILNHVTGTLGGVAGVYNRFGYDEEKRRALEAWERMLLSKDMGMDNVVELARNN